MKNKTLEKGRKADLHCMQSGHTVGAQRAYNIAKNGAELRDILPCPRKLRGNGVCANYYIAIDLSRERHLPR